MLCSLSLDFGLLITFSLETLRFDRCFCNEDGFITDAANVNHLNRVRVPTA
jgi:hypothetical protein